MQRALGRRGDQAFGAAAQQTRCTVAGPTAVRAARSVRSPSFFAAHGITFERVLTDNGSCYKSTLFTQTLTTTGITHKRIRPYRPQTNGKVELFNRTLLDEWPTI